MTQRRPVAVLSALIAVVGALAIAAPTPALAIDPETIVKALTPRPKAVPSTPAGPTVRSFKPAGTQTGRGIDIEGGEVPEAAPARIDLYVHFEYDQSSLTMSDARLTLDALGKALADPRLAKMKFEIIGHTDARGGDAYNEDLSKKRAQAVMQYLVQFHKINASLLRADGRGRRELKDPSRPDDAINRRVEVRTIPDGTS